MTFYTRNINLRHATVDDDRIARALRRTGHTAKRIARDLGRSPRAIEAVLNGVNTMRSDALIRACAIYDEVWSEVRAMAGREPTTAEAMLEEITRKLQERR